jgi:hypothetical protein
VAGTAFANAATGEVITRETHAHERYKLHVVVTNLVIPIDIALLIFFTVTVVARLGRVTAVVFKR